MDNVRLSCPPYTRASVLLLLQRKARQPCTGGGYQSARQEGFEEGRAEAPRDVTEDHRQVLEAEWHFATRGEAQLPRLRSGVAAVWRYALHRRGWLVHSLLVSAPVC